MNNTIKIYTTLLISFLTGTLFALHGKIVFYDGTYVMGKVTKVDEATVYIIPIGLDTPEGVLIGNIDSLNMENGMVPVLNSAVKYFYEKGEFIANNDDWMDEYERSNSSNIQNLDVLDEYIFQEEQRKNWEYYNLSLSGGVPLIAAESLVETDAEYGKGFTMSPNIGFSFQTPYMQLGPVDYSGGVTIMNYSFKASHQGHIEALQIASILSFDFNPILYFMPDNFHLTVEVGPSYNVAYDMDQTLGYYPNIDFPDGDSTVLFDSKYRGIGANMGASAQYWFTDFPIGFKFFFSSYIVPQAPPFTNVYTFFISSGLSMNIVLKRYHKNNKPK